MVCLLFFPSEGWQCYEHFHTNSLFLFYFWMISLECKYITQSGISRLMGINSFVILPARSLAGLRQQTVFPGGEEDTRVFRISVHFIKPKLIFTNSNGTPAFQKWRHLLFFSSCINYLFFQASLPISTASGLRLTNISFLHQEKQIWASSLG